MNQPIPASGLKSRRFTLFGRMYDRYALEPLPAEQTVPPAVSSLLQGVIDISALYSPVIETASLDLRGAAGSFVSGLVVPGGELWHLLSIAGPAVDANTGVFLAAPDGDTIRLSLGSTAPALLNAEVGHISLEADWDVGLGSTGAAGDGARILTVMFRREFLS